MYSPLIPTIVPICSHYIKYINPKFLWGTIPQSRRYPDGQSQAQWQQRLQPLHKKEDRSDGFQKEKPKTRWCQCWQLLWQLLFWKKSGFIGRLKFGDHSNRGSPTKQWSNLLRLGSGMPIDWCDITPSEDGSIMRQPVATWATWKGSLKGSCWVSISLGRNCHRTQRTSHLTGFKKCLQEGNHCITGGCGLRLQEPGSHDSPYINLGQSRCGRPIEVSNHPGNLQCSCWTSPIWGFP